jgi:branched-chain amino acid transport system substrate-binding protein
MVFDPNQKNVAPMYLGTVQGGAITYRVATMEKASASTPPGLSQPAGVHAVSNLLVGSDSTVKQSLPYAQVGEDGVSYVGPVRDATQLRQFNARVRVVLFGPGASAVAQSPEMLAALKDGAARVNGVAWEILPVESDQNWGAASTQLVHALMDEHALAIVALDRDSSHLAEQLALKSFVPVIALSGDRSLTSTNVPWIFRLPADARPAYAMRVLTTAVMQSGLSPDHLRDVLASGRAIEGVAFERDGEPRGR